MTESFNKKINTYRGPETTNQSDQVERQEVEELIDNLLEIAVIESHKINEGNNGLIATIDISDLPQEIIDFALEQPHLQNTKLQDKAEVAIKILKIYTNGAAKAEYEAQLQAYNLLTQAKKDNPDKQYAQVPVPMLYRKLEMNDDIEQSLKAKGVENPSDAVEVILMDYIKGDDLATLLYKEVLRRHTSTRHFTNQDIAEMSFSDIHFEVSQALGYSEPGKKDSDTGARFHEEFKVTSANAELLINFLSRNGFQLNTTILTQIENSLKLMHQNKTYHYDAHERNFIITDDEQVYMVDFGGAVAQKQTHEQADVKNTDLATEDLTVVRTYKKLTKTKQAVAEQEVGDYFKSLENMKTKIDFPKLTSQMLTQATENNIIRVAENIANQQFSSNIDAATDLAVLLVHEYITSNTLSKKQAQQALTKEFETHPDITRILINKLTRLIQTI